MLVSKARNFEFTQQTLLTSTFVQVFLFYLFQLACFSLLTNNGSPGSAFVRILKRAINEKGGQLSLTTTKNVDRLHITKVPTLQTTNIHIFIQTALNCLLKLKFQCRLIYY